MENEQDYQQEKFDAYIFGEMTTSEKANFLQKLEEDEALKNEFDEYRTLVAGMRTAGRSALKDRLEIIHNKKVRDHSPKGNVKRMNFLPWVAAAVLLALVSVWFILPNSQPQDVFAQYYQPYDLKIGLRDSGGEEVIHQIDDLYAAGEYSKVTPIAANYLIENPADNKLRLALAISLFENNQVKEALDQLTIIDQSNDPFLKDQVNWYKALMKIKSGDNTSALEALQPLVNNPEADHHKEAKQLIQQLR